MALENSQQLYKTSNPSPNFNVELNKTFDFNKCDEHLKLSGGIIEILNPCCDYDSLSIKENNEQASEVDNVDRLESDESLGILPDLLNDFTLDPYKTKLCFSETDIDNRIHLENNDIPASSALSPPTDNEFNRMSVGLKNISTPLPNFMASRRLSSTPKNTSSQSELKATDVIGNIPFTQFLPNEKEVEPIIADSCRIKYETDFNLDDIKDMLPLASTFKALPSLQLSSIFNELNEEIHMKSAVNFQETSDTIENIKILPKIINDVFPSNCNIQSGNFLNNTFQIKQPVFIESDTAASLEISPIRPIRCNTVGRIKNLDSTFVIHETEINCPENCEKTFVIDHNSDIGTGGSYKSICNGRILDGINSEEFSPKQQDQITNLTFSEAYKNTQINLEKRYDRSSKKGFKLLEPITDNEMSLSNSSQLIEDISFSHIGKRTDRETGEFHTSDLIQNEISDELNNIPEKSSMQNFTEQAPLKSLDCTFAVKSDCSLDCIQSYSCDIETVSPKGIEDDAFILNTFEGTETCSSHLHQKENASPKMLENSSKTSINATFSKKTDGIENSMNSVSIQNDVFQSFQNSSKEIAITAFTRVSDKQIKIQQNIHLRQDDCDSMDETASSNISKSSLNNTYSGKVANKCNSSSKSHSFESKTVTKSTIVKSANVHPRKIPEHNSQLSFKSYKPKLIEKRTIASNFKDNSTDQPFSGDFNKRLSVSIHSDNKSKPKNDFKKPLQIPSNMSLNRPTSSFQKSKLDTKFSNGPLKNNILSVKQKFLTRVDLISDKNSKTVKSVIANTDRRKEIASRLSLHEKIPNKLVKMKESRLETNVAITCSTKKSSCNVASRHSLIGLFGKQMPENKINNAKSEKKYSTNLPGKFSLLNNIPKPAVAMRKSMPASNFCNLDSLKTPGSENLPKSAKPRISLLPKARLQSSLSNENALDKKPAPRNQMSTNLSSIPEGETVQSAKTQFGSGLEKPKVDAKGSTQPNTSIHSSSEQAVQNLNSTNVPNKSNRQCSLLPTPRNVKSGIASMISKKVISQESELKNQAYQQITRRPQLRRLSTPHYS